MSGTEPEAANPNSAAPGNAAAAASQAAHVGWFQQQWTALTHGAASIYHEVVALEADVTKWSAEDPEIADLLNKGLSLAESYIERYAVSLGIPAPLLTIIEGDVLAQIKAMAAADPTVPSGGKAAAPPPPQAATEGES